MKALKNCFRGLRAYRAFVAVMCVMVLISCDSCKKDILPEPEPVYTKAVVVIKPAEKVTKTSATIVAKVVPNGTGTVSFQYKEKGTVWVSKTLPLSFSGKDSIIVTLDISDLKMNTDYSFLVVFNGKAEPVTSAESNFKTFAVSDFDGNMYHTVTIGTQTFLQENFRGTHYANGDPIPNVTDPNVWANLTTGAYCWYNNDPKNGEVYGGLYNWYVGADPRGLIPGWHVPTANEWVNLSNYLGNVSGMAGTKLMDNSSLYWKNPKFNPTNLTKFTALPNGRFGLESTTNKFEFMELGTTFICWSSDLFGPGACVTLIESGSCMLSTTSIYSVNRGYALRIVENVN